MRGTSNFTIMVAARVEASFFTATILEWKHLLKNEKYKQFIVDSMRYLVKEGCVQIDVFALMDNHIHMIWQIQDGYRREAVQQRFMRFTAQHFRYDLMANHPEVLEAYRVDSKDRMHQFWERNPLSFYIFSLPVLIQKILYVHLNPVRAGLVKVAGDYYFSSASDYENGTQRFEFLTKFELSGLLVFWKGYWSKDQQRRVLAG